MPRVGVITASLTAQNTFSDSMKVFGRFNFALSGTWVATVHVQVSYDDKATWLDVAQYTANGVFHGDEYERAAYYRFGVQTGNYTSGTVVGRLSRGGVKFI